MITYVSGNGWEVYVVDLWLTLINRTDNSSTTYYFSDPRLAKCEFMEYKLTVTSAIVEIMSRSFVISKSLCDNMFGTDDTLSKLQDVISQIPTTILEVIGETIVRHLANKVKSHDDTKHYVEIVSLYTNVSQVLRCNVLTHLLDSGSLMNKKMLAEIVNNGLHNYGKTP